MCAQSALDKGLITESLIDTRLERLFSVRMRLGHFDPPGALQRISTAEICSPHAKRVAHDGVAQSVALLLNNANTLPLVAARVRSAAVIGPNGNLSQSIASYYGPYNACDGAYPTMLDAVQQYVQHASFLAGVPAVDSDDRSGIQAAVDLAKVVDLVRCSHAACDFVFVPLIFCLLFLCPRETNRSFSPSAPTCLWRARARTRTTLPFRPRRPN